MIEPALYREVIAQPLDDEPRLILADWFEERGDVRGEFIRLQCQLHRGASLSREPLRREQKVRLAKQLDGVRVEAESLWRRDVAHPRGGRFGFIRGFPAHASLDVREFCELGREICTAIPLQAVTLTGGTSDLPSNLDRPWLRQLSSLTFQGVNFPPDRLSSIVSGDHVGNLQSLSFHDSRFSRADFQSILATTSMPSLRALTLDRVRGLPQLNLDSLKTGAGLRRLESLSIGRVGPTILGHVGSSLKSLEVRGLAGHWGQGSWIETLLADAAKFQRLTRLVLHSVNVTDHGFTELVTADAFPQLESLGATHGMISDEGAFVFAVSEMIGRLLDIDLSRNDLTADGIRAIWRSRRRRLDARLSLTGQAGVHAVAQEALCQEFEGYRESLRAESP